MQDQDCEFFRVGGRVVRLGDRSEYGVLEADFGGEKADGSDTCWVVRRPNGTTFVALGAELQNNNGDTLDNLPPAGC